MISPHDQQRETRRLRLSLIFGLAASLAAAWIWIELARPANPGRLAWQTLGFLSVPGKYVVFSGLSKTSPLGPWGLAVLGLIADILLALALAALLEPLGKVRGVGPWLKRAHDRAAELLRQYPRLARMAFWGVTLYVFLPLPGTGSVGGTFAGQLMGLTRTYTVLAIGAGSAVTLCLFAALAEFVGASAVEFVRNPWVAIASTIALALFVWIAYRRVKIALSQVEP